MATGDFICITSPVGDPDDIGAVFREGFGMVAFWPDGHCDEVVCDVSGNLWIDGLGLEEFIAANGGERQGMRLVRMDCDRKRGEDIRDASDRAMRAWAEG